MGAAWWAREEGGGEGAGQPRRVRSTCAGARREYRSGTSVVGLVQEAVAGAEPRRAHPEALGWQRP